MIRSFLFKICPNIDDENYYNNMITYYQKIEVNLCILVKKDRSRIYCRYSVSREKMLLKSSTHIVLILYLDSDLNRL